VLETAGLVVQMNGASQAKSLSGRPKTDKADAMWLARLTEMGLLQASFVPPKADLVGFASWPAARSMAARNPTRRVTMCDWSSRRLGTWLARDTGVARRSTLRGTTKGPEMWGFFSRRLRMWMLLAIALPLTRALVHRLALAAQRRNPSIRTAKALHQADSTVTAVSRRAARKAERRKADR
jgi:hypothetical protein